MFQNARTRKGTFLCNMTNYKNGNVIFLGDFHKGHCCVANLADASRPEVSDGRFYRLNRVYYNNRRGLNSLIVASISSKLVSAYKKHVFVFDSQPVRSHLYLRLKFTLQIRTKFLSVSIVRHFCSKCSFLPGAPPDLAEAAYDITPAEHPVKFIYTCCKTLLGSYSNNIFSFWDAMPAEADTKTTPMTLKVL